MMVVFRRVFAENARQYLYHYIFAGVCLLLISACTAIGAWIIADVVDKIFYGKRVDLIR